MYIKFVHIRFPTVISVASTRESRVKLIATTPIAESVLRITSALKMRVRFFQLQQF